MKLIKITGESPHEIERYTSLRFVVVDALTPDPWSDLVIEINARVPYSWESDQTEQGIKTWISVEVVWNRYRIHAAQDALSLHRSMLRWEKLLDEHAESFGPIDPDDWKSYVGLFAKHANTGRFLIDRTGEELSKRETFEYLQIEIHRLQALVWENANRRLQEVRREKEALAAASSE